MIRSGGYRAPLSTTSFVPTLAAAALSLAVLASGTAYAVDATWQGPGGEWTTGTNWSSSPTVPDGTATFTNNGAPTAVTISNSTSINTLNFTAAAPAYSFTIGNAATFTINGGTVNASAFNPAFSVGTGATLTLADGSTTTEIGSLAGGGTVIIGPTDPGALLAIVGSSSTTFSGSFSGAGSLELDNIGTSLTLTGASNGGNIGTIGGDLTLCDCFAGGLTISGGSLTVGGNGPFGGVNIMGGTLSVINGATLQIGSLVTPAALLVSANMIISGPGSRVTVTGGPTGIGIFGQTSSLVISNGGVLNSQAGAEIDAFPFDPSAGQPSVTVTGPGSTWNVGDPGFGVTLAVGGGTTPGPGTLTIANGGTVNVAGSMVVGDAITNTSLVTVTGPGSVLNVLTSLHVGEACDCLAGTLTVANGGVVNSPGSTAVGRGSTLNLGTGGLAGSIVTPTIANDGAIVANFTDSLTLSANISGAGSLTKAGAGALTLTGTNTYTGGTSINGGTVVISADVNLGDASGVLTMAGGTLQFNAAMSSARTVTLGAGDGTFNTNGNNVTLSGMIGGSGGLTKAGNGTLTLGAANTYAGGTTVTGGLINFAAANNFGPGQITLNGGGLQWASGNTADISSKLAPLGAGGATFDTNGNTLRFATGLTGSGGLTKTGAGGLFLIGANSYTGGTIVNNGILHIGAEGGPSGSIVGMATVNGDDSHLAFLSTSSAGNLVLTLNGGTAHFFGDSTAANATITANAASTMFIQDHASGGQARFIINAGGGLDISPVTLAGTTVGSIEGAGSFRLGSRQLTVGSNNLSTTVSGVIADGGMSGGSGGSLVKVGTGTLTLSGANTYTGPTAVNAGTLVVNGSLASGVTVNGGGLLGGSGTVGALAVNGGVVAPGNSIGTLTVSGNFAQNGGTYQVEANSAGQADRINAGGTATINGGTVQVLAQQGTYARNTTYTILNARGGLSGSYSGVTSNFAFLTPTLAYDANNVFLTLFQSSSAFAAGAQTPNQYAVGVVLDQVNATAAGDLNTVLNALSVLSNTQGPQALNAISGQPYADFGTLNVQGAVLFMNAVGQQMAVARGGALGGGGQRQALAQACDIASCDGVSPWGAWASALGGLGSVAGNGNSSTLTYNFGGAAAGLDYRVDPRFFVGLAAGYTAANQWVDSFMGRGWSDTVSVTAYGSFTQRGFYADALAGYAYYNNQMQRQILIPGLQLRTANGSTGANQFLGQVEAGYKLGVYAPALATLTPFGRFQTSSVTQNAFSEWGANSLSLNVAQQTTNSVRTTFGADLAGAIGLGDTRTLDLALRLGWQHEFADTGRPITAAFTGAPGNAFTVYGATPQRDAAIIGFMASTSIAAATSVYLRYDGAIGSGTDNHTLNVGVRMTW
jgi:autotransporter-associated beta strand protein/T5SS/PEP-CTERM-associated repeat protein